MANLVITTNCNNQCTFCFANNLSTVDLSLNSLKKILPFINSIDKKPIKILGGEPTLNLEFVNILEYLLNENYEPYIFTNGNIAPSTIKQLLKLTDGNYEFAVNRSVNILTPNIISFYKKFGYRINLGLTIYKLNQPIHHIIEEIENYRLKKTLRIGISLPFSNPSANTFIKPNEYSEIANEIFPFLVECIEKGIKPEFDCGFPYCFFTDNQKDYFLKNNITFSSNCGIIPDILPDQTIIPCFPLYKYKMDLSPETPWSYYEEVMKKRIAEIEKKNLFASCESCEHLYSKKCNGGCVGYSINNSSNQL